jgi:hypothetical protein
MVTRNVVPEIRRYPFVAWKKLKPAIDWKRGQHVLTVGGTGSGKSTVAGEFYPRRAMVAVAVSKGMDDIFSGPYYRDYHRATKWPPRGKTPFHEPPNRVLLWPPNGATIRETRRNKEIVFQHMFDDVLLHKGEWCLGIDETHYMCESLKLEREITDLLEQGRSARISLWNNTQRPSGIPLAVYVNSSHCFFFQTQEEYDVKRLGSLANSHTNPQELKANITKLDPHEFVYVDCTNRIPPVRSIVDIRK